jgi:hypothetical protein
MMATGMRLGPEPDLAPVLSLASPVLERTIRPPPF